MICPLCGQPDTRPHRYLQCAAHDDIRVQFPDAVGILSQERPEWMYIPLARSCPDAETSHFLFHNFP